MEIFLKNGNKEIHHNLVQEMALDDREYLLKKVLLTLSINCIQALRIVLVKNLYFLENFVFLHLTPNLTFFQ